MDATAHHEEATTEPRGLGEWLLAIHQAVDRTLDAVAGQPEIARCTVTRELGFEPRPGLLRAIVRIARDGGANGARRALPRRALAATHGCGVA